MKREVYLLVFLMATVYIVTSFIIIIDVFSIWDDAISHEMIIPYPKQTKYHILNPLFLNQYDGGVCIYVNKVNYNQCLMFVSGLFIYQKKTNYSLTDVEHICINKRCINNNVIKKINLNLLTLCNFEENGITVKYSKPR